MQFNLRIIDIKSTPPRTIEFAYSFLVRRNESITTFIETDESIVRSFNLSKLFNIVSEPRILIRANTDLFGGNNLAQSVFVIDDIIPHKTVLYTDNITTHKNKTQTSYSRYPNITHTVIGYECSLASKVVAILSKYYPTETLNSVMNRLLMYALLRYFIGFLLYGRFDVNILLRKYTVQFYNDLSNSRYSKFIHAFTDPLIVEFERYFKCNICN